MAMTADGSLASPFLLGPSEGEHRYLMPGIPVTTDSALEDVSLSRSAVILEVTQFSIQFSIITDRVVFVCRH